MSAPGRREVAHRVFAAEYDEATYEYSESDEERAPNYVVTPTGARVNRLFFVGVLTEVESVSEDVLRARVADPTGTFVVYAGQYQPDAMAFLERVDPPTFLAVTGKARTFSPDDSDRVFTSVRPESINEVDAETRDRWTLGAAQQTLARVATFAAALDLGLEGNQLRAALEESGVDEHTAAGIPLALEHYGTGEPYLAAMADLALDGARWVAGELDEIPAPDVAPDAPGEATIDYVRFGEAVDAVVDLVEPSEIPAGEPTAEESPAEATSAEEPAPDEASAASGATGEPATASEEGTATLEAGVDESGAEPAEEPPADTEATTDAGASADAGTTTAAETGTDAEATTDAGATDDIGDFEPGGVEGNGAADDVEESAGVDDESLDEVMDDEERERIEEEYPGFSTGSEVDEPGQADIEPEGGPIEPTDEDAGDDVDSTTADGEATTAESSTAAEAGTEAASSTDADEPTTEESSADEPAGDEPATGEPAGDESAADESSADETTADEPSGTPAGESAGAAEEPPEDLDLEDAVVDEMTALDEGDGADREELVAAMVEEYGADPGAVEDAIQDALMAGKCYEPDDGVFKPI